MRRWTALLLLLALCGAASGCFVADQIEQGQKEMDAHRPTKGKEFERKKEAEAKAERAQKEKADEPGLVDRVEAWWAKLGPSDTAASHDDGPPPDPRNVLGTCDLGSGLTFMRKFECQRKGGHFTPSAG